MATPTPPVKPFEQGEDRRSLLASGVEGFGEDTNYKSEHDRFYSFKLLRSSRTGRVVAYWILGIVLLVIGAMFLPWQQNIRANGQLTAFRPQDRPQDVNATIGGMIDKWYVREGQYVEKGDPLLKLSEIKEKYMDPNTLQRIQEQVQAKERMIEAKLEKATALRKQINALEQALQLSLNKAQNKLQQAKLKVVSDSAAYAAARIDYRIAKTRLDRQKSLLDSGLVSLTAYESRQLKFQETEAKVTEAANKYDIAQNELANARIQLNSLEAEYQEKIAKATSDLNATLADVSQSEAEVAKLRNEYSSIEIRNNYYVIRAPQNGYVVKALKQGVRELVKDGDPVVTIMPANPSLAVELYVRPADVPLLTRGRPVRLQFDGWPALQFSGWPSVSVGTFGGIISVIDYVNSRDGKYRVLVTPDPSEDPWPTQLRVGSGVYGWAMLDQVRVWYEIWRQLNAFPPSLQQKPDDYNQNPEKYAPGSQDPGKSKDKSGAGPIRKPKSFKF